MSCYTFTRPHGHLRSLKCRIVLVIVDLIVGTWLSLIQCLFWRLKSRQRRTRCADTAFREVEIQFFSGFEAAPGEVSRVDLTLRKRCAIYTEDALEHSWTSSIALNGFLLEGGLMVPTSMETDLPASRMERMRSMDGGSRAFDRPSKMWRSPQSLEH